jgi:hypothetical protein
LEVSAEARFFLLTVGEHSIGDAGGGGQATTGHKRPAQWLIFIVLPILHWRRLRAAAGCVLVMWPSRGLEPFRPAIST